MKVLVVGSGGREHAICYAFAKSPRVTKLYCADGNAGISEIAEIVPIKPVDVTGLADFAASNSIDITFVGGELPLSLGIADTFTARGLKIVGASQSASRLESSKSFAKDFMQRHGVPTAAYVVADSVSDAIAALESGKFGDESSPVVIKADGLAAGKGVIVAAVRTEAIEAVRSLEDLVGSEASQRIVLEERLIGPEVSLLMFVDGNDFVLMPPTRDHKRIGDGDTGPNTGGMGTITDDSILSEEDIGRVVEAMIRPTLAGCIQEGFPFRGILFLGLMMTQDGPKLLEYNVRFGDPETQAILVRLNSDLAEISEAMIEGELGELQVNWREGSSACVVVAASGYPASPRTGDVISGLESAKQNLDVEIFHAGTARSRRRNRHLGWKSSRSSPRRPDPSPTLSPQRISRSKRSILMECSIARTLVINSFQAAGS